MEEFKSISLGYGAESEERPVYYAYNAESIDRVIDKLKEGQVFGIVDLILATALCPKGRVLDVGAHIGTFSLILGLSEDHEIIAIEGSPKNALLYQKSLEKNGFKNIKLVNAAVSDKEEEINFLDNGTAGAGVSPDESEVENIVRLNTRTIADILEENDWDKLDFVKMDIEGYEVKALRGMRKYLETDEAPIILFEVNAHSLGLHSETPNTLLSFLEECGYMCFIPEGNNEEQYLTSEIRSEEKVNCRSHVSFVPVNSFEPIPVCVEDFVALKEGHVARLLEANTPVIMPYPRAARVNKIAKNIASGCGACVEYFVKFVLAHPFLLKEKQIEDAFETVVSKGYLSDKEKNKVEELLPRFSN